MAPLQHDGLRVAGLVIWYPASPAVSVPGKPGGSRVAFSDRASEAGYILLVTSKPLRLSAYSQKEGIYGWEEY